jgi:hypothetical protein
MFITAIVGLEEVHRMSLTHTVAAAFQAADRTERPARC